MTRPEWTLTKPTKPGHYWVRSADVDNIDISSNYVVVVDLEAAIEGDDALVCRGAHWKYSEPVESTNFWWLPVEAPADPPFHGSPTKHPDVGLYEGMFEIKLCRGDGLDYYAITLLDGLTHRTLASATMRPDLFSYALSGRTQSCKLRIEEDNIAKWERHPAKVWKVAHEDVRDVLTSMMFTCRDRRDASSDAERAEWLRLEGLLGKALGEWEKPK